MSEDLQGRKFPPVGYCVYCGSDGGERGLREEHIVPFSLGGTAVLPAASCADCEGITSYLDGVLARSIYYDLRLSRKSPSRTPAKKRPKTRTAVVSRHGRDETYDFAVGDHPFTTVVPLLGLPGIVRGSKSTEFGSMKAAMFYYLPPGFDEAIKMSPDEHVGIVNRGSINLDAFARAIAKIAWGHAVAMGHDKSIDAFPICDLIRGRQQLGAYLVGSDPDETPPPAVATQLHKIDMTWNTYRSAPETEYLVSYIRLFANAGTAANGMPTYMVFLGTRRAPPPAMPVHQEAP